MKIIWDFHMQNPIISKHNYSQITWPNHAYNITNYSYHQTLSESRISRKKNEGLAHEIMT